MRLELVARKPGVHPALVGEDLLPGGGVHGLFDIGGDGGNLLGGKAGAGPDAAPVLDGEIDAAFLEGRGIDDLDALGRRDAEDAELRRARLRRRDAKGCCLTLVLAVAVIDFHDNRRISLRLEHD